MTVGKTGAKSTDSHNDRDDYQRAFRKHVFQLLKLGYDRLDASFYENWKEPAITGELKRGIKEVLNSRMSPKWTGRYTVREEEPIDSPDRKGVERQRIDIEFERVQHGPRPVYPFEAKRLCTNTHSIGLYLGSEGLGEFLAGNYASNTDEAGMLGYIQSESPKEWAKKAKRKFEDAPESFHLCPDGNWASASIIEGLDFCFHSKHDRPSMGKPIAIYHLFLIFC